MNLLCWIFGHQEYNQVRNLDMKDEYWEKICYRCGRVKKLKPSNPWVDYEIQLEENIKRRKNKNG